MRYPDYLVHYNKNHDKRTGRFTFGDGNGDGVSPDDYRTPELDAKYNKYKTSINNAYGHEFSSGLKGPKGKSFVICVKALENIGAISKDEASSDYIEQDIFDFFNGYQSVAYLANKGYDKNQIKDIILSNHKFEEANKKSIDTYPYSNPYLESVYKSYYNKDKDSSTYKEIDKYIDECIKLANDKPNFDFSIVDEETKHSDMDYSSMDYSEYLMHFNKNHDKKSGRFSFGDGDGDGIRDDHSNQSKKQSKSSDGSKKTIMISSPKNPHNPFSGREKTKVEVSDDAYKEFMKADTKHDIIRGTSNLVTGGLYLAVGVLTENPVALGVGVASLVSSAVNYVDSGTHFVNKIVDSVYKDKPVGEIESLIKVDPSIFGNKKYYDPKTKEIVELSYKEAYERNKAVGYK